jgi:hypothetical protein
VQRFLLGQNDRTRGCHSGSAFAWPKQKGDAACHNPSEEEVPGYFDAANWGRWGADDELGTPNLITPEKTKRALATVREGVTVSLAREIRWEGSVDVPSPLRAFMLESGEGWASGDRFRAGQRGGDRLHPWCSTSRHHPVDSLAHFFWKGKTYNGKPAHLVSTSLGATVAPWWRPGAGS